MDTVTFWWLLAQSVTAVHLQRMSGGWSLSSSFCLASTLRMTRVCPFRHENLGGYAGTSSARQHYKASACNNFWLYTHGAPLQYRISGGLPVPRAELTEIQFQSLRCPQTQGMRVK